MRKGQVIIGANYGDEGKGLMTDYFASQNPESSIIVRFNGGAQAGHTVVAPDGRRHVFGHFGAGSFLGCPTYLSPYFIVNPMLFLREHLELESKGIDPYVYLDRRAIVTTPFDVFINQFIEARRARGRHGSCGVGINETVTRSLRSPELRVEVADLLEPAKLEHRLTSICQAWLPDRLRELNVVAEEEEGVKSFLERSQDIIQRFLQDVEQVLSKSMTCSSCPAKYNNLIFEGAQGLLLDEARIDLYPHLTRSRTGLTNVIELARALKIDHLDVSYITRTYLTRHGAGPLPGEESWTFPDLTNIPNMFQGHLRFATLDLEQLAYSINKDLSQAKYNDLSVDATIAFTCVDHIAPPASRRLPLSVGYLSEGPTRENVHHHKCTPARKVGRLAFA